MLGPKINTVFRSRWNALLWSAGILATAYCSVPSQDESAQLAEVARQAGHAGHAQQAGHVNPWAKPATNH